MGLIKTFSITTSVKIYCWKNQFFVLSGNRSYGTTVRASAANRNLIKLKAQFLPLFWINWRKLWLFKVVYWLFKNANEFKLFVCCCWYLVFTSVDLLPVKIKFFDRLKCISTVMLYFLIYWVVVNTKFTT